MFLTNNLRTISNLIYYSKYKHSYRILLSDSIKEIEESFYSYTGESIYGNILNTGLRIREYNMPPYGNIGISMEKYMGDQNVLNE